MLTEGGRSPTEDSKIGYSIDILFFPACRCASIGGRISRFRAVTSLTLVELCPAIGAKKF